MIRDISAYSPTQWQTYRFEWGMRTYIMGIINMTPDSFAGDGLGHSNDPDVTASLAVQQAILQIACGATIIDVGGASSRPDFIPLDPLEEIARVVPAIRAIAAVIPPHIPISIDTTSAAVAEVAIEAGAALINDVTGLQSDSAIARIAAQANIPVIAMANMRGIQRYETIADITRYLARSIDIALTAGISWDHIILDPGFGFGNTPAQNIAVIRHLDHFRSLGRPLLLGVSRKSTLGVILDHAPVEERLEASVSAAVVGITRGADILRVHDVLATARAAKVADAIVRGHAEM